MPMIDDPALLVKKEAQKGNSDPQRVQGGDGVTEPNKGQDDHKDSLKQGGNRIGHRGDQPHHQEGRNALPVHKEPVEQES